MILLDFDGVIVDSLEVFSESVNVAGNILRQPVNFNSNDLRSIRHMAVYEICRVARIQQHLAMEFLTELDLELIKRAHEIELFPRMEAVLRQISSLTKLIIVSASTQPMIDKVLKHHNVRQYVDQIVGGDTAGEKSNKIRTLLTQHQTSANSTYMIGDTVSDVEQGKIAGVNTIAVTWGWHKFDWLCQAKPDYKVHDPDGLLRLVEQLLVPNSRPYSRNLAN